MSDPVASGKLEANEPVTVHLLAAGVTLCGLSPAEPNWPKGDRWLGINVLACNLEGGRMCERCAEEARKPEWQYDD